MVKMDKRKREAAAGTKRVLFDGRYGWILDEWKEPSQEALAGGRGMFSILPLTKALINTASHSVNFAASFTVRALENPDVLSPQALQASLNKELNKFKSFIRKPEAVHLAVREDSPIISGNLRFYKLKYGRPP